MTLSSNCLLASLIHMNTKYKSRLPHFIQVASCTPFNNFPTELVCKIGQSIVYLLEDTTKMIETRLE